MKKDRRVFITNLDKKRREEAQDIGRTLSLLSIFSGVLHKLQSVLCVESFFGKKEIFPSSLFP